ncbi:hypothetical protein CAP35_09580 [Chitinophagaceae bacterium IBVUCB1]|nr:hypothetical protein CAP35_09580 [Chitinophagaceae bacterium IBVUCB1]
MPFSKFIIVSTLSLLYVTCVQASASVNDSLRAEILKAKNKPAALSGLYTRLAYNSLGTDGDSAIYFARKAQQLATSSGENKALAIAYMCLTYAYDNHGNTDAALACTDTAKRYADKANDYILQFHAELMMGSLCRRKANYEQAIKHAMQALAIAERNNDQTLTSNACNNIGILYTTLKDIGRAEEFHLRALNIRKKLNNADLISQSLNNLGIINRERGDYDKALSYYKQALNLSISIGDTQNMAFLYNDIGAAYSKKGDVTNGELYLKESINIREKIKEYYELAYTYNYLGENYERKNDLKNAELYIKKALSMAKQIANNKQTYEALESLSDFYARNSIYDSAYVYAIKYRLFRDSLVKQEHKNVVAELTTRYETVKKEQTIATQQLEIDNQRYIIAGVMGIALLTLLLAISIFRRNKLVQATKLQAAIMQQQELATKGMIEAEEKERKRIAAELHDGIGQLMSAAKLNLSSIKSDLQFTNTDNELNYDKALGLVDESCKEIRNISHNIMPNALLKSGLNNAIREFVDKIDTRIIKVNLHTEGIAERLSSDVETVLYRVIQECVNNVIKHANASRLDISIIKDKDGMSITIEDNGLGFDTKKMADFNGIGLKNIQNRIQYLRGTVEWDSSVGRGTIVSIHLDNK